MPAREAGRIGLRHGVRRHRLGIERRGAIAPDPQPGTCRVSKVFATPDPKGLGPYVIGRRIYASCMQCTAARAPVRSHRPR